MVVCFHRTVLMTFGLWTSAMKYEFKDGNFHIEKCDATTSNLIQKAISIDASIDNSEKIETQIDLENSRSSDELIFEQEHTDQKVLFKHVVAAEYEDDEEKVKPIYRNQTDLIKAHEEVTQDSHGEYSVELKQDEAQLKLRIIDSFNSKVYPANRLVVVDNVIEEPLDFLPSVTIVSLYKHLYIGREICSLMKPKQVFERKQVDVYKYMFFCEFINFLILLFGFMEFVVRFSLRFLVKQVLD